MRNYPAEFANTLRYTSLENAINSAFVVQFHSKSLHDWFVTVDILSTLSFFSKGRITIMTVVTKSTTTASWRISAPASGTYALVSWDKVKMIRLEDFYSFTSDQQFTIKSLITNIILYYIISYYIILHYFFVCSDIPE